MQKTNWWVRRQIFSSILAASHHNMWCNILLFVLLCSINDSSQWIPRQEFVTTRRQIPCACPSVPVPQQQTHSLPSAGGEGAVGGNLTSMTSMSVGELFRPESNWSSLFQVSFSSYMPPYHCSEDSRERVDRCVLLTHTHTHTHILLYVSVTVSTYLSLPV